MKIISISLISLFLYLLPGISWAQKTFKCDVTRTEFGRDLDWKEPLISHRAVPKMTMAIDKNFNQIEVTYEGEAPVEVFNIDQNNNVLIEASRTIMRDDKVSLRAHIFYYKKQKSVLMYWGLKVGLQVLTQGYCSSTSG